LHGKNFCVIIYIESEKGRNCKMGYRSAFNRQSGSELMDRAYDVMVFDDIDKREAKNKSNKIKGFDIGKNPPGSPKYVEATSMTAAAIRRRLGLT
jgi:hypothetical protein